MNILVEVYSFYSTFPNPFVFLFLSSCKKRECCLQKAKVLSCTQPVYSPIVSRGLTGKLPDLKDVLRIACVKPVTTSEEVRNRRFNSTECGQIYKVYLNYFSTCFSVTFMNTQIVTLTRLTQDSLAHSTNFYSTSPIGDAAIMLEELGYQ